MHRIRIRNVGFFMAVALLAATGCAGRSGTSGGETSEPKPMAVEEVAPAAVKEVPPPPPDNEPPPPLRSVEMAARNSTGTQNIPFPDVLFDFDQYVLRDDALTTVEENAKRLKANGITRIVLEGRTDEIGTVEYNLVLGERRARGVQHYLENLGLEALQIEVTSFGKDRPLCLQHNTDCWQKNRSVHFVVKD
ncbi:MAG: OmpA family protein [Nitrospiraceae bacterium]